MPFVSRPDGAKIYYQLTGRDTGRPPLVLVHGWCSRHELWTHQVAHFRKTHQIVLLDRRGQGRSTTSGIGHHPAGHAGDISAVVRATGLKGVVAIGHAGGAAGTLEFIRSQPRLVRAGVIVDAFMYGMPKAGDKKHPLGSILRAMIATLRGPRAAAQQAFRGWYTSYFHPRCDRAMVRKIVAEAARVPNTVKAAEIEGLLVDVTAIADGIRQPVLWLTAGAQDQAYVARHLKNVGFAQVYGAAHFPQFEQPAQSNAAIEAFLARI